MTTASVPEAAPAPDSPGGLARGVGVARPLFTYRYKHGVDTQGRIQFPSRWKLRATDTELVAVLVHHRLLMKKDYPVKEYLLVLPYDLFDVFTGPLRSGGFTDTTAQAFRHEYAERMMTIDFDGSGRFSLPSELRGPAGLEKEALLVGCVDRFEIWNPAAYEVARDKERDFVDGVNATDRIEL